MHLTTLVTLHTLLNTHLSCDNQRMNNDWPDTTWPPSLKLKHALGLIQNMDLVVSCNMGSILYSSCCSTDTNSQSSRELRLTGRGCSMTIIFAFVLIDCMWY